MHGVNHFKSTKNLEQLRLQVERLEKRGQVSSWDAGFALRCRVQAGSEAHSASCPGCSSSADNRLGHELRNSLLAPSSSIFGSVCTLPNTRWFKYDRDYLCVNKSQFVPVIFEPPCISSGQDAWLTRMQIRFRRTASCLICSAVTSVLAFHTLVSFLLEMSPLKVI